MSKSLFPSGLLFLALILSVSAFSACAPGKGQASEADTLAADSLQFPIADITSEAEAWADSMLSRMTLEERAGQLLMPALYASADPATLRLLRRYVADLHVGGIVLLKGSVEASRTLADTLRKLSGAAPFVAIDAEWGLGMRLSGMPVFPANGVLSADVDQELMYDYGREVARECRLAGINMVLGPVADVAGPGSMIGRRSFGLDPRRVADLTVAYGRGLEDGSVISVAKHFPGHGSPRQDSHRKVAVIEGSRERLDSVDLPPFRAYVGAGLSGIMSGHLAVPALDAESRPASFSPPVLTGLLRGEMGFRGLILTDALNMGGAKGFMAADALLAGADIVLAPSDTRRELQSILDAVAEGWLPVRELNDRCRRVLFYKYLSEERVGGLSGMSAGPLSEIPGAVSDTLLLRLEGK